MMLPVERLAVLLVVAACHRPPAAAVDGAQGQPAPVANEADGAPVDAAPPVVPASPGPPAAEHAVPLAPDEGLTKVEPLRPGPDDVDRALLLRLRRHADAAVKVSAQVRSGDARLVAYAWDEIDAWWREVHREGKTAEVRAELRRRRRACEAELRQPDEDGETGGSTTGLDELDELDDEPHDMDTRSCWERAVAAVAPSAFPVDAECLALAVVRVTDTAIEPLWSYTGACVDAPAAFELVDVAGAGWPQLVLQVRAARWDMTRLGFEHADTSEKLVVLDPRKAEDAEMFAQNLTYETEVDEAWHWHGSYAHVTFARGRHVTVLAQEWRTTDECEIDEAGWAVSEQDEDGGGVFDEDERCTAEWRMTRKAWDPARQRWSDTEEASPRPEPPPARARELPVTLSFAEP